MGSMTPANELRKMLLIYKGQGSAIVPTVLTFEYCRDKGFPCPKGFCF